MEGTTTPGPVHELLLRLAGKVDDDLMSQVRELVAVREDGRALELLTAAIAADAAVLPADVRAWLVGASRAARTDLDADSALAPAGDVGDEHRFTAEAPPGSDAVVAAVRALPTRWLEGCDVRLTWRLTPAGAAPGALPHPVLLVRTAADGSGPDDVIAYQLAAALDRDVALVSVEVVAADHVPSAYHAAAWRAAVAVRDGDDGSTPLDVTATRRAAGLLGGPTTGSGVTRTDNAGFAGSHRRWAPGEADPTATGTRPAPGSPLDGDPQPVPVRNGRTGIGELRPHVGPADISVPDQQGGSGKEAVPSSAGTRPSPVEASDGPLPDAEDGPRDGPVDAPRPLPMRAAGGRRRLIEQSGPQHPAVTPLPRAPLPRSSQPSPVPFVRRNRPSPRPLPAAVVDPEEGSIPRPNRPGPAEWTAAGAGGRAQNDPLLGPLRRPPADPRLDPTFREDASRKQDQPAAGGPRASGSGPDVAVSGPVEVGSLAGMGLRPESLARLSDADRALLARLQSELMAGRRSPDTGGTGQGAANGAAARPDPSPSPSPSPSEDG